MTTDLAVSDGRVTACDRFAVCSPGSGLGYIMGHPSGSGNYNISGSHADAGCRGSYHLLVGSVDFRMSMV